KDSAQGLRKTSGVFALFHEKKCAVAARLFEGKARVSKPQAHKVHGIANTYGFAKPCALSFL
ncbi:MAG: hypothetical protein J6M57_03145, partial [Acidaminococcaceae bacterium]|nr:hypothetical protein [Acidaminococcaceae bacterium]